MQNVLYKSLFDVKQQEQIRFDLIKKSILIRLSMSSRQFMWLRKETGEV